MKFSFLPQRHFYHCMKILSILEFIVHLGEEYFLVLILRRTITRDLTSIATFKVLIIIMFYYSEKTFQI